MFNPKSIITVLTLTILSTSWPLPAKADSGSDPKSLSEIANLLSSQRLQAGEIADLLGQGGATNPQTDLFNAINPQEGLPTQGNSANPGDVIDSAYSSVELIKRALSRRLDYPMGPRIDYMSGEIDHILRVSKSKTDEMLMRYVLNRSRDLVSFVLPSFGNNTLEVAREIANFYKESFELAASFANNRCGLDQVRGDLGTPYDVAEYLQKLSMADFGRTYATLVWRYSTGISSGSSKGIMLMRLLTYLGWDMNMDLRRRQAPIAQIIADVYELQHSAEYNRVLNSIQSGFEPKSSDLAQLRVGTYRIMQSLPERLAKVGNN